MHDRAELLRKAATGKTRSRCASGRAATFSSPNAVVVVGCGSQASRHLKCLAKLRASHDVRIAALVDPCESNRDGCRDVLSKLKLDSHKVLEAATLEDLPARIDLSRTIVDIVTPNRLHYAAAAEAVRLGARRLIVEKPLAHTLTEAKRFLQLDCKLCVLENYLYSNVTRAVRELIRAEGWNPLFVKSEFSKDRRVDSIKGRGTAGRYVPHVFTVEMPHQLAIVGNILGSLGRVVDAWHHDMILPDGRIADHGEGAITLLHENGVPSYNFSCLQGFRHSAMTYRCVRVYCADRVNVFGYYSTTIDLDGAIRVFRGDRLVRQQTILDDSLKSGLQEAIECLEGDREPLSDLQMGIDVLRVIEHARRVATTNA